MERNKEIEFAQELYNNYFGINNWIITNEFGGTRVIERDVQGFNYAYMQLKDDIVNAINKANGHDDLFVKRTIGSSF
tara:strand:- start:737 stop:967 length:231 start_codon:yes stop_codon:yes gene_type:complete